MFGHSSDPHFIDYSRTTALFWIPNCDGLVLNFHHDIRVFSAIILISSNGYQCLSPFTNNKKVLFGVCSIKIMLVQSRTSGSAIPLVWTCWRREEASGTESALWSTCRGRTSCYWLERWQVVVERETNVLKGFVPSAPLKVPAGHDAQSETSEAPAKHASYQKFIIWNQERSGKN